MPVLGSIPDELLTHFIENVDLPANALQAISFDGVHRDTGERTLNGIHIHVPPLMERLAVERALLSGTPPEGFAKARAYGIGTISGQTVEDDLTDVRSFHTVFDTALALVFHHPEIMILRWEQPSSV